MTLFSLGNTDLGAANELVQATIRARLELEREEAEAPVRLARARHDAELQPFVTGDASGVALRYRENEVWRDVARLMAAERSMMMHTPARQLATEIDRVDQIRAGRECCPGRGDRGMSSGGSGRGRLVEVVAVILLGIATVGSAFCAYESTRWNTREGDLERDASTSRVEANRLFSLGTQTIMYDTTVVTQYAAALSAGDQRLVDFYLTSLVRPKFLPIIDEWTTQVRNGETPANLLSNQAYVDEQLAGYTKADAAAEGFTLEAGQASEHADAFVLTALLLAVSLFFAGVTSSFRVTFARLLLLIGAVVTLAIAAGRIADLPII